MSRSDCYIFDLDGTLAKMNGRSAYNWNAVDTDLPNEPVVRLYKMLMAQEILDVIVVSGRDSVCRAKTEAWLSEYCGRPDALFMRPQGDNRDDRIVKQEIYEREIKGKYRVLGIFDDRNKVVRFWRSLGLPCFQVAEGDF